MGDSEKNSVEICSNCHKLLDSSDRVVRDGSGMCSHMYSQECIRYQREQLASLNSRLDELERQYLVKVLPK